MSKITSSVRETDQSTLGHRLLKPLEPHWDESISIDDINKGRILIVSCLTAISLMIPVWFIQGSTLGFDHQLSIIFIVLAALLLAGLALLKCFASVQMAAIYITAVTVLAISSYSFIDGGFQSAAIVWYPLTPMFATFLGGQRAGWVIASLSVVSVISLVLLHGAGQVPAPSSSLADSLWLYAFNVIVVTLILMVLAFAFVRWQAEARELAQRANKEKTRFLNHMSHEIRTPLNGIVGMTQLLTVDETINDDKRHEYLSQIAESSDHLLNLVNGLLDIAKIESGQVYLDRQQVNVDRVIEEVLAMTAADLNASNIHFDVNRYLDVPAMARVDPLKFKQILINLVSNALRFARTRIAIETRQSGAYIEVTVQDDGDGVAETAREAIFEPYVQASNANAKSGGTGLGLPLSRMLAESMLGALVLADDEAGDDEAGKGALFILSVPAVD